MLAPPLAGAHFQIHIPIRIDTAGSHGAHHMLPRPIPLAFRAEPPVEEAKPTPLRLASAPRIRTRMRRGRSPDARRTRRTQPPLGLAPTRIIPAIPHRPDIPRAEALPAHGARHFRLVPPLALAAHDPGAPLPAIPLPRLRGEYPPAPLAGTHGRLPEPELPRGRTRHAPPRAKRPHASRAPPLLIVRSAPTPRRGAAHAPRSGARTHLAAPHRLDRTHIPPAPEPRVVRAAQPPHGRLRPAPRHRARRIAHPRTLGSGDESQGFALPCPHPLVRSAARHLPCTSLAVAGVPAPVRNGHTAQGASVRLLTHRFDRSPQSR